MPEVHFKIDGKPVSCERDSMLFEVARENGIYIPAPCHHDGLPDDYGACRICLVEIEEERWTGLDTACTYPVREKCVHVRTDTEEVRRHRRLNLELLLSRCPDSDSVRELARSMGVETARLPEMDLNESSCVLCGLCVNVCEQLVGAGAIGFVGRGARRRVAAPFDEPAEACIGCGACAEVCPTDAIRIVETPHDRIIEPFSGPMKLVQCNRCGRGYATERQVEFVKKQLGNKSDVLAGCPNCSVHERAREFVKTLITNAD